MLRQDWTSLARSCGPLRRMLERVLGRNAGRQEVADISGDDGQPIFQRSCGDQKIGAAVTDPRAEPSPSARDARVDGENTTPIGLDSAIEPCAEGFRENRILSPLSKNTSFDLTDGDR